MILEQFRLDGRVALVTGANRGLGKAIALGLAEAGADVVALNRSSGDDSIGAHIQGVGRRYHEIIADLGTATADSLNEIVQEVESTLGSLDILVNNAGIIRRAPALEFSETDWDAVLQVNLRSVFFLAQAAARVMVPRKQGKIINIASMLSFQGGILVPSYAAAKSGVAGLTRALANEWAGHGINVNAIAPGYMSTDNTAPLRADSTRADSILARIPTAAWGTPEELQGAVVFLASDAARYVHGAVIPVDGGWLAR